MINFLLLNFFAWFATGSLCTMLWMAIQKGQIFGGWQEVLRRLDLKGSPFYKLLGGCKLCTAQFFTILSYLAFAAFTSATGLFPFGAIHLLTWYLVYVPIGAIVTFLFLTKIIKE